MHAPLPPGNKGMLSPAADVGGCWGVVLSGLARSCKRLIRRRIGGYSEQQTRRTTQPRLALQPRSRRHTEKCGLTITFPLGASEFDPSRLLARFFGRFQKRVEGQLAVEFPIGGVACP